MENTGGYNDVYKNKRMMKVHLAIDSRERNKKINSNRKTYSDPNDFQVTINKYKKFRNVVSVRLIECMMPNSQFLVNSNNKYIDIILPGASSATSVELTPGNYNASLLATHIKTILNTALTDVGLPGIFTVTLNSTTYITTISNDTSDFTLLFETGTNNNCSIADVLGFEKEDVVSTGNSLSGVYAYHLNSSKYVDLKIDEIPDIGTTIDIKENVQNQILKRIPLDVAFGKEQYYKSSELDRLYNYFNPIELSRLNIKIFSDTGKIYDSNRIDNYFILELLMLQDEAPDNVGFHPKQNDALKDIKSKVDTLIVNDSDVMISNKTDNDFMDIYENLTNDDNKTDDNKTDDNKTDIDEMSFNKDIIIDDDTVITDSLVNSNEVENTRQTNIKDLNNESGGGPEGISEDTSLLNNISEFDKVHYDKTELNHTKLNNKSDKFNPIAENDLVSISLNKKQIFEIFEDYKLLILTVTLFLLAVLIIKQVSKGSKKLD
jgi:hypothetical protein